MSKSAVASVGLSFPQVPGFNPAPIGTSTPILYTALVPGIVIPIATAETYVIDLAMMPATGLTYLQVSLGTIDAIGGAVVTPVKVVFTNGYAWIGPGGSITIATPALASGGVTGLSIVTTMPAVVTVTLAG